MEIRSQLIFQNGHVSSLKMQNDNCNKLFKIYKKFKEEQKKKNKKSTQIKHNLSKSFWFNPFNICNLIFKIRIRI